MNKALLLSNLKTKTAMNANYLSLYNLHDCTFKKCKEAASRRRSWENTIFDIDIDIDISIKFLVLDEQLKTQGSVFCRISIIIFKGHVNPQACK